MSQIFVISNGKCSKCGKDISTSETMCSECVWEEILNGQHKLKDDVLE